MQELLEFSVYVPIDTPEINQNTPVYAQIIQARMAEAEHIMLTHLPDDWEVEFSRKYPEDNVPFAP